MRRTHYPQSRHSIVTIGHASEIKQPVLAGLYSGGNAVLKLVESLPAKIDDQRSVPMQCGLPDR